MPRELRAAKRVLVVDDDPKDANRVAAFLQTFVNARVEFASDRREAWSKLRDHEYDLLLLDLDLGGLSEGRLLLDTLKTHLERPPGAIIVSYSGSRPEAKELRRFEFVIDSISKDELELLPEYFRRAVQRALGDTKALASKRLSNEDWIAIIVAVIAALSAIIAAMIGK